MIEQLIQQTANWQTVAAADLFAALTAPQMDRKPDAEAIWSIAGIARVFGVQVGEAIYQGIVAANMPGVAARFASVGLDARDDQWLAVADQLAVSIPALAKYRDALKYIGFDRRSAWERQSDEELTIEAVESALVQLKAAEFAEQLIQRTEGAIRLAVSQDNASEQSIIAAVTAELEA